MRDKLIELIASKVCDTYSEACDEWLPHDCGKCYANNCHIAEIADHLIANGVAFDADNSVGDKSIPTADKLSSIAEQKWIPVTDRLPEVASKHKYGRSAYAKSIRVLCTCVQKDGKKMVKEGYCELWNDYPKPIWKIPGTIDSVTHWMYMPELPKE